MCDRSHLRRRHERREAKSARDVDLSGIKNTHDFFALIDATCADVAASRISPAEGKAINARLGSILRGFELALKNQKISEGS